MTHRVHRWVPDDDLASVCATCGVLESELRRDRPRDHSATVAGRKAVDGSRYTKPTKAETNLLAEIAVTRRLMAAFAAAARFGYVMGTARAPADREWSLEELERELRHDKRLEPEAVDAVVAWLRRE